MPLRWHSAPVGPAMASSSTQTAAASTPRPRSVGSLATTTASESLSRRGQCWDNAVGESWFATLKEELVHRQSWATRAQVRRAVFDYIEVFYNRQRLHSSLGFMAPAEYEAARLGSSGAP